MAAYQSQAVGVTMQATPGLTIPRTLQELHTADFYVSLCAHSGRPEVLTAWFDPAVADEREPFSVVAELDMYNPKSMALRIALILSLGTASPRSNATIESRIGVIRNWRASSVWVPTIGHLTCIAHGRILG